MCVCIYIYIYIYTSCYTKYLWAGKFPFHDGMFDDEACRPLAHPDAHVSSADFVVLFRSGWALVTQPQPQWPAFRSPCPSARPLPRASGTLSWSFCILWRPAPAPSATRFLPWYDAVGEKYSAQNFAHNAQRSSAFVRRGFQHLGKTKANADVDANANANEAIAGSLLLLLLQTLLR